jgi:pyruvate dehydrogenase E2 component (dihydrolipoamide acetyltransferase)
VTEQGIALLPQIHVGIAVAVPSGLLVPVVRNADRRPLADLAAETARLADLGRAGRLKLPDLEGGTFSVSALGMYGVDGFTPVINPPNVAILGVGRLREELALRDGQVTPTRRLTLSLTWDHRVFDGVPAAQFAQAIVAFLADPAALDA